VFDPGSPTILVLDCWGGGPGSAAPGLPDCAAFAQFWDGSERRLCGCWGGLQLCIQPNLSHIVIPSECRSDVEARVEGSAVVFS